jgi:hypothetical protein
MEFRSLATVAVGMPVSRESSRTEGHTFPARWWSVIRTMRCFHLVTGGLSHIPAQVA